MDIRSKRIKDAIEKSGYSYAELEKITGISKSSIQRYATGETKKIPIDCIEKIADATRTSAKFLMGWEDDKASGYIYNKIKEMCDMKGITISELSKITKVDIDILKGYDKRSINNESIYGLKSIADYFGVITSYFWGYPDNLEMAKRMVGMETIGEIHRVSQEYKNQAVVDLADKLDNMNDEDREYFVDLFERILSKYYKMLEQIDRE